jgi:pimeloyl-ACP methyl ester carboxylesterase
MMIPVLSRMLLAVGAGLALSACVLFYPAKIPMQAQEYRAKTGATARTLLVMLPGRLGTADQFMSEGLVDMVQKAGYDLDVIAAEAYIGYYYNQTLVERLHEDIILPAKGRGYSRIWILGISMGGMGAVWYDRTHPGEVDGLILLAPYLGDKEVAKVVEAAGGLRGWRQDPQDKGRFPEELWGLLKGYEDRQTTAGRLFLGYGLQDDFALSNSLLALELPADQVVTLLGSHDWPTWRLLLTRFLENQVLRHGMGPLPPS